MPTLHGSDGEGVIPISSISGQELGARPRPTQPHPQEVSDSDEQHRRVPEAQADVEPGSHDGLEEFGPFDQQRQSEGE